MSVDRPYGLGKTRRQRRSRWPYLVFVAALAVVAMSVATQRVASLYGFQPALGTPLAKVFGTSWYAPWKIFDWQGRIADRQGHVQKSLAIAQAIFILPQLLVLGLWLGRMRLSDGRDDLHGSACWADEADIRAMGAFRWPRCLCRRMDQGLSRSVRSGVCPWRKAGIRAALSAPQRAGAHPVFRAD